MTKKELIRIGFEVIAVAATYLITERLVGHNYKPTDLKVISIDTIKHAEKINYKDTVAALKSKIRRLSAEDNLKTFLMFYLNVEFAKDKYGIKSAEYKTQKNELMTIVDEHFTELLHKRVIKNDTIYYLYFPDGENYDLPK